MFQTSPASAGLGKLGLEPSVGNQDRSKSSADSFSQEFDKQVKNLNKKDGVDNDTAAESARPKHEKQAAAAKDESPGTSEKLGDRDPQGLDEAEGEAQSGKTLPQSVAGLLQLEELSDEAVEGEVDALPVEQEISALLKTGEEMVTAADKEFPIQPFAFAPVDGGSAEELAAPDDVLGEAEEELVPLRLRDVLSQRFAAMSGEKGAEPVVGKEGKFDLQSLLPGQPLPVRGPSGTEGAAALGAASAVGSVAPQGNVSSLPVAMTLAVPLQQKGWDQAMGERVVWMARSNIQEAQVQLNPRELGPIEIKISVKQDQAHVQFVAHHATTRDALEAAMPRLRDMLNESGLNLAQSDVSQHSFRERESNASAGGAGSGAPGGELGAEGAEDSVSVSHVGHVSPRGIDYFA